jgi:hypothetical protein
MIGVISNPQYVGVYSEKKVGDLFFPKRLVIQRINLFSVLNIFLVQLTVAGIDP